MASSVLSNAALLRMAVKTTIGQVPPLQVNEETGETIVRGEETDKIVTAETNYHLVELLALIGVVSGSVSFYFVVGHLVDFMSLCLVLLAPVVALQKFELRELGGFRTQHNLLRQTVGQLRTENEKLTQSVAALTVQTSKLQQVEQGLQSMAATSGQSVDKLVEIVNENGKIQKEILENLQAGVLQQIMTAVLQTDSDRNFIVSSVEVEALVVRLKNLPGVVFDEAAFRSFLRSDKGELTLMDVCAITRHLKESGQTIVKIDTTKASSGLAASQSRSIGEGATMPGKPMFQFQPKDILKLRKQRSWLNF